MTRSTAPKLAAHAAKAALLSVALSALLAGCGGMNSTDSASVTPDDPGYKALLVGDFAKSRDEFAPQQARAPRDAYLELDLAVAYQQLGRKDLAEPLDRQAMTDGKDIVPPYTTFDRDKGKSIAFIACENIAIANARNSCDPVAARSALPPPVRTFIVFFDFNQSKLTTEGHAVVAEAVKTVRAGNAAKLVVTGHTDTVGSDRYNQALSARRAEAAKAEMVDDGLNGSQISTAAKSFHEPLVPTGPGVREPQNRRAVIDLGGSDKIVAQGTP